jgi:hypothetical protein
MASFAELDSNNVVLRVISVHNNELLDNGVESEQKGIDFCKSLYGQDTKWKQTSYNTLLKKYYKIDPNDGSLTLAEDQSKAFRKHFATIGGTYNEEKDAFIPRQPFPSWTFDENNYCWDAPVPHPIDGEYNWNEAELKWDLVKLYSEFQA